MQDWLLLRLQLNSRENNQKAEQSAFSVFQDMVQPAPRVSGKLSLNCHCSLTFYPVLYTIYIALKRSSSKDRVLQRIIGWCKMITVIYELVFELIVTTCVKGNECMAFPARELRWYRVDNVP